MDGEILAVGLKLMLGALCALIVYRLLNGSIKTRGMLRAQLNGPLSPERIQLLIASLLGVGHYATVVMQLPDTAKSLPEVPETLLFVLAASQGIYVSGKLMR